MKDRNALSRTRLPVAVSAAALTLAVAATGNAAVAAPAAQGNASTAPGLPGWANPSADARPMTRSWWPDAGAGESAQGLAMTAKHVDNQAKAGFGGMEVAFLSDQLTSVPQSATLPASQRLGQPGVDQNMAQTSASCCLDFSNAQAATVGYGTENWQKVLTQIYQTANAEKDGFAIDLTLSQHWPIAFNNIDPNDAGQMQVARTAYSPITSSDVAAGTKDVPVPAQRLWDLDNVPFVFADHYQAATIVKVASVAANGTPTFSYASLTDATSQTSQQRNADGTPAGQPAGIMDAAWINANPSSFTGTVTTGSTTITNVSSTNGAQRQAGSILSGPGIPDGTQVVSVSGTSIVMSNAATSSTAGASLAAKWNINTVDADWGPNPVSDPDGATFTGKIDAEGNRRRMADWQYQYQTSINSSTLSNLGCTVPASGAALAPGDCVLFGTWSEGTGQTRSGGVNTVQHNREYVTSEYNRESTQSLIDFWDNNILGTWHNGVVTQPLGDTTLLKLIRANVQAHPQDSVFEDSLEFSKPSGAGNYWTGDVLGQMSNQLGYDAATYAPVLAGGSTFDSTTAAGLLPSTRVAQDWTSTLGKDVATYHTAAIQNWAKSTLGYNFRFQDVGGTGVQHAQIGTGVHEDSCDSGCSDNGRDVSAAAALTGSNWVTAESLTNTKDYINPWLDDVEGLNQDWAAGINRPQWHGTPYVETFNGANSGWPGWEFQHGSPVGWGAFDARQAYWGDVHELTDYVARSQTVLQSGVPKVDLFVLRGTDQSFSAPSSSSNSLQTLMDAGWTYHLGDDRMLLDTPNAVVRNGLLDPNGPTNGINDGPGYKAVVLNNVSDLKVATVNKLIQYANAGLPIIFFNSTVSQVYGTNQPGGNATSLDGNNDTALAAALATLQSKPGVYTVGSASSPATQAQLISQLQAAGLASNASYSATGLETVQRESTGREYYYLYNANKTGSPLTATVSLAGTGQPYVLDAWTGKVTPIADYTSSNGSTTVSVTLAPQDATIIETSPGSTGLHATATSGGEVQYTDGNQLALRATQAGDYTVSLSNGKTTTVHIDSVPASVDLSNGWSLDLESWGPDANATDPTVSAKTTTSFAANALGSWSNLPATTSQLAALGVSSMSQVSGIGRYNNTFQLPASWHGADGALMSFTHGNGDMVVAVTVNGHTINTIDQVTNTVDVGPYLQAGANTIVVKLDTNLGNRVGRSTQTYGLTGASFQPYTEVGVQ